MKNTNLPLINLYSILKDIRFQHKQKTIYKILLHEIINKQLTTVENKRRLELKCRKDGKLRNTVIVFGIKTMQMNGLPR